MKPGPMGMNDLVVVQAAQGLARYCLEENSSPKKDKEGQQKLCAVVGYDHRANSSLQLSSLSFAILTALVFQSAGLDCLLLDGFVATPLVPFCLSQIENAVVGVMITASHNPKLDAGYKVYWNDGCQIRSPIDKGIAQSIEQNLEPWHDYRRLVEERTNDHPTDPCIGLSQPERTREMIGRYFQAIAASGLATGQAKLFAKEKDKVPPKFCYTAMHGVGYRFAKQSFEAFDLPPFVSVPQQQDPDPSFPTVPFPNPEEKGALDLAKLYAEENGCQIVLANDPDADRLAVAEYISSDGTGTWHVFTGDQIGTMLGHWLWEEVGKPSRKPVAMCASTVSSKMLAEIARVEGFHFEETLTGFKWIGSRAAALQSSGYNSIFCYEEAIGFCCGNVIFDKDGVTALSVFAELAVAVYRGGMTLSRHMQSLYDKYGEFVSNNGYYFLKDQSRVPLIMDSITNGGKFDTLKMVGPYEVKSIRYLGEPGYDSAAKDKKPTLPTSKASPMMKISFANGCVAQFRASGTEPKFKYYIELKGDPGRPREQVQEDLIKMSDVILEELLHPSKNGLYLP